jgi:hypothetical protein
MESKKSMHDRFIHDSCKRNMKIQVKILWEYRRSDGTEVASKPAGDINLSMEREMRIIN